MRTPSGWTQAAKLNVKRKDRLRSRAASAPVCLSNSSAPSSVHQPGRAAEQDDEGRAHGNERVRAGQFHAQTGNPEGQTGVIEITQGKVAGRRDVIGFGIAEVDLGIGDAETDQRAHHDRPGDQRNRPLHSELGEYVGRAGHHYPEYIDLACSPVTRAAAHYPALRQPTIRPLRRVALASVQALWFGAERAFKCGRRQTVPQFADAPRRYLLGPSMTKFEDRALKPAGAGINDDIGEEMRLALYRIAGRACGRPSSAPTTCSCRTW